MLKWIIELLKRIFMQPETTDKTTENTNVDEKKILSRATIATTETLGAYWKNYNATESVTYLKTGTNNYCIEGYFGSLYASYAVIDLTPLNHIEVNTATGTMGVECLATESSIVNPAGNFVYITYAYKTVGVAFTNMKAYRIIYATAVTQSSIW